MYGNFSFVSIFVKGVQEPTPAHDSIQKILCLPLEKCSLIEDKTDKYYWTLLNRLLTFDDFLRLV